MQLSFLQRTVCLCLFLLPAAAAAHPAEPLEKGTPAECLAQAEQDNAQADSLYCIMRFEETRSSSPKYRSRAEYRMTAADNAYSLLEYDEPAGDSASPVRSIYKKDGIAYMLLGPGQEKIKMADSAAYSPPQTGIFAGFHFGDIAPDGLESQTRDGTRLHFVLSPEAVREHLRKNMYPHIEYTRAELEVILGEDGGIGSWTAEGAYSADGAPETFRITCEFVQRGGVVIDFPEDLDTYSEAPY